MRDLEATTLQSILKQFPGLRYIEIKPGDRRDRTEIGSCIKFLTGCKNEQTSSTKNDYYLGRYDDRLKVFYLDAKYSSLKSVGVGDIRILLVEFPFCNRFVLSNGLSMTREDVVECLQELLEEANNASIPRNVPDSLKSVLLKNDVVRTNAEGELIFDKAVDYSNPSEVTDFVLTLLRNGATKRLKFLGEVNCSFKEVVRFFHGNEDVLNALLSDFNTLEKQVKNGFSEASAVAKCFMEVESTDIKKTFLLEWHPDKFSHLEVSEEEKAIASTLYNMGLCINRTWRMLNKQDGVMDKSCD